MNLQELMKASKIKAQPPKKTSQLQESPASLTLTRGQALNLLSPWHPEQRGVFLSKYRNEKEFKAWLDEKVKEYRKDPMVLVNADASQAEVRVAADMSGEPKLLALYQAQHDEEAKGIDTEDRRDLDLHFITASLLFKKPLDQLTVGERKFAKTITFAVLYGASEWKVAMTSGIPVGDAKKLLDSFWSSYPNVRKWVNVLLAEGVVYGYVSTPLGRRKATPALYGKRDFLDGFVKDKNPWFTLSRKYNKNEIKSVLREMRQARNFPVQSMASDIMTTGVSNFLDERDEKGIPVCIHTLVHDSIVASVPFSRLPEFLERMKYHLEVKVKDDLDIGCPLKIEQEIGFNYDAQIKLPTHLSRVDWKELPSKMYDKYKTLSAQAMLSSATGSALALFEPEHQKLPRLSSKEEQQAGFTNEQLAIWFDTYQERWKIKDAKKMEKLKEMLSSCVKTSVSKEETDFE